MWCFLCCRFDFPLLGIDLLAFGKGKVLCVVDFQPLSQDSSYLEKYTAGLAPIRKDFTMFCSKMSSRIYNENEFFSKQLIFYRSDKGAADPLLQVFNYVSFLACLLSWMRNKCWTRVYFMGHVSMHWRNQCLTQSMTQFVHCMNPLGTICLQLFAWFRTGGTPQFANCEVDWREDTLWPHG